MIIAVIVYGLDLLMLLRFCLRIVLVAGCIGCLLVLVCLLIKWFVWVC